MTVDFFHRLHKITKMHPYYNIGYKIKYSKNTAYFYNIYSNLLYCIWPVNNYKNH